jgi:hypothetical protein
MIMRILTTVLVIVAFSFPAAAQQAQLSSEKLVDIDFEGGTINELIQTIQKNNVTDINIIMSDEAACLYLPAMTLRSVTIADLITALQSLGDIEGRRIMANPTSSNIITISVVPMGRKEQRMSKVFNLSEITKTNSIDDIVTSIKTAWEMMSNNVTAELKYHTETKLLIVVGTVHELETVHDIFVELTRTDDTVAKPDTQAQIAKLKDMIKELHSDLKALKKEVENLKNSRDGSV